MAVGGTFSGQPAQGRTLVRIDPRYLRPTEVDTLLGVEDRVLRCAFFGVEG